MHLDKLKADMETRERETRELEKLRDQEIEEEEERLEHEHRQRKSHSRAASVSSRTSRRRGSSVKPAERSVARDDNAVAAETAVKKRLAIAAKESKKASAAVVPRATGRTKPNTSLMTSTTALLSRMQAYMTTNSGPVSMLQTIVMLAVIAWMTNNKRMRDRIRRFLLLCWIKIAKTVGMGMKVTYV
jgi:hypothetical protein